MKWLTKEYWTKNNINKIYLSGVMCIFSALGVLSAIYSFDTESNLIIKSIIIFVIGIILIIIS